MLDFLFPARRRAKLRAQPLDPALRAIVERNVPYFALLTDDERRLLEGHVNVFLAEKPFEGCGGLEITEPQPEPAYYPSAKGGEARLGESHQRGIVVLSWADARATVRGRACWARSSPRSKRPSSDTARATSIGTAPPILRSSSP